jgi:hypothetical protein
MTTTVLFCDELPFDGLMTHLEACKANLEELARPFADATADNIVDDHTYQRYSCKRFMDSALEAINNAITRLNNNDVNEQLMFKTRVTVVRIPDDLDELLKNVYSSYFRFDNLFMKTSLFSEEIVRFNSETFFKKHVSPINDYQDYISEFASVQDRDADDEYSLLILTSMIKTDDNHNVVQAPSLRYNLLCTVYFNTLCYKTPVTNTIFTYEDITHILSFIFKGLKKEHDRVQELKRKSRSTGLFYANEDLNPGKLLQALCDITRDSPPNSNPHAFTLPRDILVLAHEMKKHEYGLPPPPKTRARARASAYTVTSQTLIDYVKKMLADLWSNDDFEQLTYQDLMEFRAAFQDNTYLRELFEHIMICVGVSDGPIGPKKTSRCKGDTSFNAPRAPPRRAQR